MGAGILGGIRVVELGHAVAGPTAGQVLADLGAEVIKVERPGGGDIFRDTPEMGPTMFIALNRGKKSVAIDLSRPEGRELFRRLVSASDVLITNLDPQALRKLGVTWEEMSRANERLVMCEISGFGAGPYGDAPALDPILQAMTGIMSVTGLPPDKYVRAGISLSDQAAAFHCVIAVLAALLRRASTGRGAHITISLFDSDVFYMSYWIAYRDLYGKDPLPLGTTHIYSAPYNLFRLRDGLLYIAVVSDGQWRSFCRALGFDDLLGDPRYATQAGRVAHKAELEEEVQRRLSGMGVRETFERLVKAGVPAAPLYRVGDLLEDPHAKQSGSIREVEWRGRRLRVSVSPYVVDGERLFAPGPPPELGQHTDEVLKGLLGLSDEEVRRLREEGVVA